MRKKILSLITVLCLIFPCFFVVACKSKETLESSKTFSYSILLKNAKGFINEASLIPEYDYEKDENVSWGETDGNYTISAKKLTEISGKYKISLVEGYDYDSIELKINDQNTEYKIVTKEEDSTISSEKELQFEYKKIFSDTQITIDFSNCTVIKVKIDVSDLKAKGVKYYEVNDEFLTLKDVENIRFSAIEEDEFVVDYGTIFAFDFSDQLSVRDKTTNKSQKLDYASYGIRYFTSEEETNRVQYLTAKNDCECEVYNIKEDSDFYGTLRVLSCGGMKFAASLSDLENEIFAETTKEEEIYYGEKLEFTVFSGTEVYVLLSDEDLGYNYYFVEDINRKWTFPADYVRSQKITIDGVERRYLHVSLTDSNGVLSVRYLTRVAQNTSNYYVVYARDMDSNTKITNADYILVNKANYSKNLDDVLYFFKKDKDINISVPGTSVNQKTSFLESIKSIYVNVYGDKNYYNIDSETSKAKDYVDFITDAKQVLTIDAYSSERQDTSFRLEFVYTTKSFSNETFTLSTDKISLYDGEEIYYSTNLTDWKKLEIGETLSGSTKESKPIYYYINTTRNDSYLLIEKSLDNVNKKVVSLTGLVRDCFGRAKQGVVDVDGTKINLSKVMYLELQPGYYESGRPEANIVREYDKNYHSVNISSVEDDIMISFNGYETGNFQNLSLVGGLNLRYEGYDINSEIFYYVKANRNKYLVLKNSKGEIVSTSELVYLDSEAVKQEERYYVHQLSLKAGYYAEDEQFTLSVVNASYILTVQGSSSLASVYTSALHMDDTRVTSVEINKTYFVLCSDDKIPVIYDKFGDIAVSSDKFIEIADQNPGESGSNKKLYQFTFTVDDETLYSPKSEFEIRLT